MRVIKYYGKGDIRLEDVPEPDSLKPQDVLLKPKYCGICGTDLHEYSEGAMVIPSKPHTLTGAKLPQILGHEFSADVVDVGAEVTITKPGDRVAIMPLIYCGRCFFCRRGLNHLCKIQACTGLSWTWGGFAEYCVVPDYQIAVLPDGVSYEQGAVVEPAAVGAYAVERGGVQGGENVLVAGAGPIGSLTALYAMAIGAGNVYIIETNPQRLNLASTLGVKEVFNPLDPTRQKSTKAAREVGTGVFDAAKSWVVEELREKTDGVGVDVAIDCTGNEAGLSTCINATRARGTVVEAALHVKPPAVDMYALTLKDVNLVGTWCYYVYDFPRYLSLIATGRLPVEKVISAKIPLEDVKDKGFEILCNPTGEATKILVYPEVR